MLARGDRILLTIDKPAAGGRMIARSDGQVVLVSGAIPGETVTARIERVGRGVAYAETVGVESPSADRRQLDADPACGGCAYAHVAYARQLQLKSLVIQDACARIGHLTLPAAVQVAASEETGYRMRARLHLRERHVGFFREGTHEVCDVRQTRQLREDTCDAIDRVAAALRSLGMAGVQELDVSENTDASQRVVHLHGESTTAAKALGSLRLSDGLTGLTRSTSDRHAWANVLDGDPYVSDRVAVEGVEVRLRRHVLAFFQGNRFLLPSLIAHVVSRIERGSRVIDLYAGVGVFAAAAATVRHATVTAVEGDTVGASDLVANAATPNGTVRAVHESVESFVSRTHDRPAVLVVDPPRTGLSKEALRGAIDLGAPTLVYVSCDPPTLARDARAIVDAGYTLETLAGFDLFPNTPHVESVATFRR